MICLANTPATIMPAYSTEAFINNEQIKLALINLQWLALLEPFGGNNLSSFVADTKNDEQPKFISEAL